jgi:hypothetical protein
MRGDLAHALGLSILGPLLLAGSLIAAERALPPPCPPNDGACVAARLRGPLRWRARRLPLDRAIRQVARRSGIPVSMLLERPLPVVRIPRAELAPTALLSRLAAAAPGYAWDVADGVVRFYAAQLLRSRQNPLNWRLAAYTVRRNPGENLLWLGQALWNINLGEKPTAPIEGLLPQLPGRPMAPITLREATAGRILRMVLSHAPSFTSQMIFPHAPPFSQADVKAALSSWQWIPFAQSPIYNLHPICAPSPCPALPQE